MKATLEFNLPEDKAEFKLAQQAGDWKRICYEACNELRNKIKHFDPKTDKDEGKLEAYEEIRDFVWHWLNEENLDPYE